VRYLRPVALIGAAIVVALVLFWPRLRKSPQPQPAPGVSEPVTIAVPTYLGYEPLFYGQETGYWQRNRIKLVLKRQDEVQLIAAGLREGTFDATMATVDSVVLQKNLGLPGKIILITDRSKGADGILARRDWKIKTIADLRGKKIGLQQYTASHYYVLTRLRAAGIHANDVSIVNLEPSDIGPALRQGSVPVAVTWQPYVGELETRKDIALIDSSREPGVGLYDVLYVTDESLKKDRAAWSRFVASWFALVEEIRKDPKPFKAFIQKELQFPAAAVDQTFAGIQFLSLPDNVFLVSSGNGQNIESVIDDVSTVYRDATVIQHNVPSNGIVDKTFVISREPAK
jgi:NitT/TauT family transport system substrate-binding protein